MDLLQTLIRYIRLYSEIRVSTTLIIGMLSVSLGSCMLSGFKPRGEILLPSSFSHLYISGLDQRTNFYIQLKSALEQRGSIVVGHKPDATTILQISHLRETKKVASYGVKREVRQYLIRLRFSYQILSLKEKSILPIQSIDLDKTQNYDSEFVLGKVDEEELIRKSLRKDAVRLVMLQMQYADIK